MQTKQQKLQDLQRLIQKKQDQVIKFKDIIEEIETELSDLTLEESRLELELAKEDEDDDHSMTSDTPDYNYSPNEPR